MMDLPRGSASPVELIPLSASTLSPLVNLPRRQTHNYKVSSLAGARFETIFAEHFTSIRREQLSPGKRELILEQVQSQIVPL